MEPLSLIKSDGPIQARRWRNGHDPSMTNQEITMAMFNAPSDQVVGETVTGPILGCVKTGYEPVLTAFADNF